MLVFFKTLSVVIFYRDKKQIGCELLSVNPKFYEAYRYNISKLFISFAQCLGLTNLCTGYIWLKK